MRKLLLFGILLVFLLTAAAPAAPARSEAAGPDLSTADELINAVNALRAANGLSPYTPNAILMGIAQRQAEYMASIGTWTHAGPDGSRPHERALAAGYLVAGDLSQGGWFSENVGLVNDPTVDGIIQMWMSDAPHQNTMLSPTLRDIGAGVTVSGNTYYYVIDCGLSTGGTPVAYTPRASLPTGTILPNTPNADGSLIHIVRQGDTLYGIAFAYNVPLNDILALNGLTLEATLYTGTKIYIRAAFTPTATLPTSTPTRFPTSTLWPTSTATPTLTPLPPATPTPILSPGLPLTTTAGIVGLIVLLALGAAALFTLAGRKK
ncbi:MAG: hypothetical protein FD146_599 [Anaerolineaceae bacterium]|nr:MAG: hypothetical protein FD146_599 [Anaerolineaceae bacterium]